MYLPEDTSVYRQLSILRAIDTDPHVSHRVLARQMGLSNAAIQVIMKKLIKRGFVKMKGANLRRIRYLLTPNGRKRLEQLSMSFIRNSARLFTQTKEQVGIKLAEMIDDGATRICLYGVGDVMDLVILVVDRLDVDLVGLIDDDPAWYGQKRLHFPILPPIAINEIKPDGVLVTTPNRQQEIIDGLGQRHPDLLVRRIV